MSMGSYRARVDGNAIILRAACVSRKPARERSWTRSGGLGLYRYFGLQFIPISQLARHLDG
jgi:hypothetical protein